MVFNLIRNVLFKPKRWFAVDDKKLTQLQVNPFLSNAFRLMQDADILFSKGRYSTVVGLAILSAEEIGKYLLTKWSAEDPSFEYDKRKFHRAKQFAIAALFMTNAARKEYKKQNIDFDNLSSPIELKKLIESIQAGISKEAEFANAVLNKGMELAKWSGFYYDEDSAIKGVEPARISEENARDVMGIPAKAFILLQDEKNVQIAKAMFGYYKK